MTRKVQCQNKTKTETEPVRVRVIKAPLVNTVELRSIIMQRARALVL